MEEGGSLQQQLKHLKSEDDNHRQREQKRIIIHNLLNLICKRTIKMRINISARKRKRKERKKE
jgi:hypothetical protein